MVSATPPQPLMATASTSQEDLMGILIQTIQQEFQKVSPKQVKTLQVHVQVEPTVALFVYIVPDQIDKVQLKTKIKNSKIQITTTDTITIKTVDTTIVAINKTTSIIAIAPHQIGNNTKIT